MAQCHPAHRHRQADFAQASLQPVEMPILIDEATGMEMYHLVDAVTELIAAVLDIHLCEALIDIAAVDIGNARHAVSSGAWDCGGSAILGLHAKEFQLPMQRAALHPDEMRGAADITAEAQQLGFQVLFLEQLPSFT